MRHTLKAAFVLVGALAASGCLHSPMPWSPDGKWLAYTVEVRPVERLIRSGWLFDSPTSPPKGFLEPCQPTGYRLWATRADTGESVLLEESSYPLTAPGWSPDGRALAFGRIVPEAEGRSRFEIIVLDAPGRARVIASRSLAEIPAMASRLPGQAIAWSPDGRYLAVPQLNPLGLAIIRADNGRQVNAIVDAFLPSWSADGSKLAFYVRGTSDTLQCIDSILGRPRLLAEVGQAGQAPIWFRDGQSVLAVARRPVPRGSEPPGEQAELVRVRVDSGQSETFRDLRTDAPLGRDRTLEGVSVAFDKEGQNLYCSTVIEGWPQQIVWYKPLDGNAIYKRFALLDFAFPMGSLSLSPDGRTLAARIGPIDRLSAPALCDLESTTLSTRVIAPDDSARIEWVARLVLSARGVLGSLPTGSTDPKVPATARLDRPSLLPVPGEFEMNSPEAHRLRRIGRMGLPLCERPAGSPPASPEVAALLDEARLFFHYLSGNYPAALDAVEVLEKSAETPDRRIRLLAIRAQIAIGQSRLDRAEYTISYLREIRRKPARRIEWTGAGYTLTATDPVPFEGWPDYLAWKARTVRSQLRDEPPVDPFNPDNPRANFGFGAEGAREQLLPDRPFVNPITPGGLRPIPRRGGEFEPPPGPVPRF
jgi:Tol biopolymer transport system component